MSQTHYVDISVPDLLDECINICEQTQLDCILSCDNDVACISECIREETGCIQGMLPEFVIHNTAENCLRLSMPSKLYWWLWGLRKSCLSMRGKKLDQFLFTHIWYLLYYHWKIQNIESNKDWNDCIDANSITMGRCVHACNGDESCENACLIGFKYRQLDCPCEVNS